MQDKLLGKEFSPLQARYEKIHQNNLKSWYMTGGDRPFSALMSVHGAGSERVPITQADKDAGQERVDFLVQANKAARHVLAGNMSIVQQPDGTVPYGPKELSPEGRIEDARENTNSLLKNFYDSGVYLAPDDITNLFPQRLYARTPLGIVDADKDEGKYDGVDVKKFKTQGDFIFTRDPNRVIVAKPADCPISFMHAMTPEGPIWMFWHAAWRGPAYGQFEEMLAELDKLGVDRSTLKVYITPGGQAETYKMTNFVPDDEKENPVPVEGDLFVGVKKNETAGGKTSYDFGVDTPNAVYQSFLKAGLEPEQIFADVSDTTSLKSGFASHSRAVNQQEDNVRDLVFMIPEGYQPPITPNPERRAPYEIIKDIVPVNVEYVDFNGDHQEGVVEIHRSMAPFVEAFFKKALEVGFPIESVVRSSDPEFGWDDDKLMAANTSSGFNYRLVKGTDRASKHGFGMALDINDALNPYIRYNADGTEDVDPPGATYDPSKPGTLTADHPLVLLAKEHGMIWGGDWEKDPATGTGRTDLQHIEVPDDWPELVRLKSLSL